MGNDKPTNRMYYLYELRDSTKSAINNLKETIFHQKHLIQAISSCKYKDDKPMKDLIEGTKKTIKNEETAIAVSEKKLTKILHLISLYEKKDATSILVSTVITEFMEATEATYEVQDIFDDSKPEINENKKED